ncbi:MAG: DUF1552 domain-containing protein [Polyangiaceae bacterium]
MVRKLDRRTLLRGLLGGVAVGVALPALEIFLNDNGTAYASGEGFPKRFGWWFYGNGSHSNKWNPALEGADYELSEELSPLADVKSDITVVSGLKVYQPNEVPHGTGPAALLTGRRLGVAGGDFSNSTFATATLDQMLADAFRGQTRFPSLEIAVERTDASLSYTGPGQANPPEWSPAALFDRLFGVGFRAPGDDPVIDPRLALRRSVLDAVSEDATALKRRVSRFDQQRLDQHFTAVRDLEKQIARLEEDPPNYAACTKPMAPLDEYPDIEGRAQMSAISRVMSDMLTMSLACDQTRVFSYLFSKPVGNVLYPGAPLGHHQLTHDEPGDQPQVTKIIQQIMTEYAYTLQALRSIPEGDETLLDHCLVMGFSDCSFGKSHAVDEYPVVLAGGASGRLKKGIHFRAPGANISKLGFTILSMMDAGVGEFGGDEGVVSEGLDGLEAV